MTPHYKQQFPSYDGTLPNLTGWEDDSWGNDSSPKLIRKIWDEFGVVYGILWCDWVEKASREMLGPRFVLCATDDELTIFHDKNRLEITGETIEELRSNAVQWLLDNVGDSILEEDLTTSEVLTRVVTMWAFHNLPVASKFAKILDRHVISTGGGCLAYSFDHAGHFIWITATDGCGLPKEGEACLIGIRNEDGTEGSVIEAKFNAKAVIGFLNEIGAEVAFHAFDGD